MVEIWLIVVLSGIAAYVRGRGGNPVFWGGLALCGCFSIMYLPPFISSRLGIPMSQGSRLWLLVPAAGWAGLVALGARFLLGRKSEKPSGMWSCPSCHYLNQEYAVICEACQRPYGKTRFRKARDE